MKEKFAAVMNEMMSAHDVSSGALQSRLEGVGYWESPAEFQQNLILYVAGEKLPSPVFVEAFAKALGLDEEEKQRLVQAHPRM